MKLELEGCFHCGDNSVLCFDSGVFILARIESGNVSFLG